MPLAQITAHIQRVIQADPNLQNEPLRHAAQFRQLLSPHLLTSPLISSLQESTDALRLRLKKLSETKFLGTVDALNKLDELALELIEEFRNDPAYQAVLDCYPNLATRAWVEREIMTCILVDFVKRLPPEERQIQALGEALVRAYVSQGASQKERRELILGNLPPPQVSPTICYFNGQNDLSVWGHVAVSVPTAEVPHSVVVSNQPMPDREDKRALRKYFRDLPIDPHHNAFLVTNQGYSYNMMLIQVSDEKGNTLEERLKDTIKSHLNDREFGASPILIRNKQNELYLSCPPDKKGKRRPPILLNPLMPGYQTLLNLHLREFKADNPSIAGTIDYTVQYAHEGNPALLDPDVLSSMETYFPISRKIWYLKRKDASEKEKDASGKVIEDDLFEPTLIEDSTHFDRFKQRYVQDNPHPKENARCVANLASEEVSHLQSNFFPNKVPEQATYLTYGTTPGSLFRNPFRSKKQEVPAGIAGDKEYQGEKETYLEDSKAAEPPDLHRLKLPPQDWDRFETARTAFANRDRGQYNVLDNNCAHAVQGFMKDLGVIGRSEEETRMPRKCASRTCELIKADLEKSRQKILKSRDLPEMLKVRRLLQLEIERLKIQIHEDTINHIAAEGPSVLFKNKQIKLDKIAEMERLIILIEGNPEDISSIRAALEGLMEGMRTNRGKNETLNHLEECLEKCFPKVSLERKESAIEDDDSDDDEVKSEASVSISSSSSFMERRRSSIIRQPNYPPPETWVEIKGSLGQYRYLSDEAEARRTLREVITTQTPSSSDTLENAPPLQGKQVRLSTQVVSATSTSNELRFGLLEKCEKGGQEVRSELIQPHLNPSIQEWLFMIDRQYEESCKLLGRKGTVITIHNLEKRELESTPPHLEDFEKAYIYYCLSMNLSCRIKDAGKEVTLDPNFLKQIVPPQNYAELRNQIEDARFKEEPRSFLAPPI